MENINEALLNRKTLDGSKKSEEAAATQMRAQTARARVGGAGNESEEKGGGTLRQMINQARQASKSPGTGMPGATAGAGSNPASTATAKFLKQSWLNLIDSFGGTLIYINIHVLGNRILGKKLFCDLGEEWLPYKIPSVSLLEKIVLIFLDLVVLLALLGILAIIVTIISFMSKNILQQVGDVFKAITTLGWGAVMDLFNLFK